jgi:hypothetical protein
MQKLIKNIFDNIFFTGEWKIINNNNLYSIQQIAIELQKYDIELLYVYNDYYIAFAKDDLYISIIKQYNDDNYIKLLCKYKNSFF